jgi:hypothetical protein
MSRYIYRLRAPKGLDNTLIKELRQLDLSRSTIDSIQKIPGRKAIEVQGSMDVLWSILFNSRIAEDCQVKIT